MSTTILNEHDANQGAQSKGEFLGMTGNSGWYLLGSAGTSVMMVIMLWGVLGVPLLLCLTTGVVLCLLSVAYVFTLKNNKPDHYDSDFFASAVIDSGASQINFGPQWGGAKNPLANVTGGEFEDVPAAAPAASRDRSQFRYHHAGTIGASTAVAPSAEEVESESRRATKEKAPERTVPLKAYERLQSDYHEIEDRLAEALSDLGEVEHEA